jgi:hypothetical protein
MKRRPLVVLVILGSAASICILLWTRSCGSGSATTAHRTRIDTGESPYASRRLVLVTGRVADTSGRDAVLEGRLLCIDDGQPVPNGVIRLQSSTDPEVVLTTGPKGTFRLETDRFGTYRLISVRASGYLELATEAVFEARANTRITDVVLLMHRLDPPVAVHGVVRTIDNTSVARAAVTVHREQTVEQFTSGQDGRFECTTVPGSLIEATHPSFGAGWAVVPPDSAEVIVQLEPTGTLGEVSGRLSDVHGAPIMGGLLELSSEPSIAGISPVVTRGSDPAGRFVFDAVRGRSFSISARASGFVAKTVEHVPNDTRDLGIVLQSEATVAGLVTEVGGAPVSSFTVVWRPVEKGEAPTRPRAVPVLDRDGEFVLSGLELGRYAVAIAARGFAISAEKEVEAAPQAHIIKFVLDAGARLVGRTVEAETTRPVANAIVFLEQTGLWGTRLGAQTVALTDAEGRFDLAGLPPGRHSIRAAAAGYRAQMLSGIEITGGGTAGLVIVDLVRAQTGQERSIRYAGIGASLEMASGSIVIGEVRAGGGGARAGLLPGDVLLEVDGRSTAGLGLPQVVEALRGPEGTRVVLRTRRGEAVDQFVVERRIIE